MIDKYWEKTWQEEVSKERHWLSIAAGKQGPLLRQIRDDENNGWMEVPQEYGLVG